METVGSTMDNNLENFLLSPLPSCTLSYTFGAPLCRVQFLVKDLYLYYK